ncbi:hypothetical protein L249_4032 [Ophiocordyceps polyrhachis-furcata BCC 54312]|uniref:MOSC domain-containing protein n=1 Tax=Ophiocordyceps polyrhachis-furcata BCC 54312 TaxID=1330021 RepID=A0A367L5X0_9HYPO|nr:hypothetical protein L249_4032 [Ophiocordyceps polyrhachis-furcata BCC 54312]
MDSDRGALTLLASSPGAVFALVVTLVVFAVPIFIIFPPIPVERSDVLRQTHSKLGIRPHKTNLRTQYSAAHKSKTGQPASIQSLFIYPIKSCRGIELSRAKVIPTGLEHDRVFALAQWKTAATGDADGAWEVLTLRQKPLMANVKVDVWLPDPTKKSRQLGPIKESFLLVRFPCNDGGLIQLLAAKLSRGLRAVPETEFLLPLDFPSAKDMAAMGYEHAAVKIWKDTPYALNMERELPVELARYLGVKHRLAIFRMDPTKQRQVFRCAPPKDELGYQPIIDFHDAYPLHLLNLNSIRDLESKIQKDESIRRLDARRFRGNIIISGAEAYDEDDWKSVRFKGRQRDGPSSVFDVSCRTVRCKLPNVDPATGIRHRAEPDRAIRKYREVDAGAPKMGCLGMQLCPVFPESGTAEQLQSVLEVGMEVEPLQRGSHFYHWIDPIEQANEGKQKMAP